MAKKEKDQQSEKVMTGRGVYKLGEKYLCEECDHEMEIGELCPTCQSDVDWDEVKLAISRNGF